MQARRGTLARGLLNDVRPPHTAHGRLAGTHACPHNTCLPARHMPARTHLLVLVRHQDDPVEQDGAHLGVNVHLRRHPRVAGEALALQERCARWAGRTGPGLGGWRGGAVGGGWRCQCGVRGSMWYAAEAGSSPARIHPRARARTHAPPAASGARRCYRRTRPPSPRPRAPLPAMPARATAGWWVRSHQRSRAATRRCPQ